MVENNRVVLRLLKDATKEDVVKALPYILVC